ncbi:hypothetical protein RvY_12402 [Ramazzottius varieornatus]|uniref:Uncharacterized protein n=1 Tax=Ramazzottius varieornatus TaxID=947166 RepID=A0A1D1VJE4_RAMVA|nr:hypothetical protein RvY_12402 [Ramazzottius varieornatus]
MSTLKPRFLTTGTVSRTPSIDSASFFNQSAGERLRSTSHHGDNMRGNAQRWTRRLTPLITSKIASFIPNIYISHPTSHQTFHRQP